jgi:hypothetical protein
VENDVAPDRKKLHPPTMNWSNIAPDFERDGGLRDIYILGGSLPVWNAVWTLLIADADLLEFSIDGERAEAPGDLREIFERSSPHGFLATYTLGRMALNCHFFGLDEVEFDLDPRDVVSAIDAKLLEDFLARMGRVTRQEVILTRENHRESVIARYDPHIDRVAWSRDS